MAPGQAHAASVGAYMDWSAAAAAPAPCPGAPPTLPPSPKRQRPSEPQPVITSGIVGPVLLGAARIVRITHGGMQFGTVVSHCAPWYTIKMDYTGEITKMRGTSLVDVLVFSPQDFLDPTLFFYDFTTLNASKLPGWSMGMLDYLQAQDTMVPTSWLDNSATSASLDEPARESEFSSYLARELSDIREHFLEISGEARAKRTMDKLHYPGLKALWWWASRHRHLPPTQLDVTDYLTYLEMHVGTTGSVELAREAIGVLCDLNGWEKDRVLGGRARVPLAALHRRNVHVIKKSAGLRVEHVRAILSIYAKLDTNKPWQLQWHLSFGIAIGTQFKVLARYDDLMQLRYDDGFFRVTPLFIELLCTTRKNNQENCSWLYVARNADDSYGLYDLLLLGHHVFRAGFILADIDMTGTIHRERPMEYNRFVIHLRHALVLCAGMPPAEADLYAGQSARAGGASEAARAGLPPHVISHLAGVRDINWLLGYNRATVEDKLRASWAVGI
jgi:hypothetical protein